MKIAAVVNKANKALVKIFSVWVCKTGLNLIPGSQWRKEDNSSSELSCLCVSDTNKSFIGLWNWNQNRGDKKGSQCFLPAVFSLKERRVITQPRMITTKPNSTWLIHTCVLTWASQQPCSSLEQADMDKLLQKKDTTVAHPIFSGQVPSHICKMFLIPNQGLMGPCTYAQMN